MAVALERSNCARLLAAPNPNGASPMSRSTHVLFSALIALFVTAGAARADQLQWLARADAEKAVAALPAGALYVDYISHQKGKPAIFQVVKAEVVATSDPSYSEVKLTAIKVAEARTVRQPGDGAFQFKTIEGGKAEVVACDLAYVYVPSAELPGCFVNLGKKLGLECSVRTVALEVARETTDAIAGLCTAGAGGLVDGLPLPGR